VASANPVILNPSSLLAFCVVAFWAMVVEAGVVALLLAFRDAAALPVFVAYFILNGAVFLFLFQPLLVGSRSLPVPVLEGRLGVGMPFSDIVHNSICVLEYLFHKSLSITTMALHPESARSVAWGWCHGVGDDPDVVFSQKTGQGTTRFRGGG
jgi:hypothetical protein